jgi:outer membrane protein OmpA-like peptidoglycan-associated protein
MIYARKMKKWGSFCLYLSMFLVATIGHTHDRPVKPVSFGDILFDVNGIALRKSSKETLKTNAQIVIALQNTTILIQGHADQRGGAEYNMAWNDKCTNTVKNYLIAEVVHPDRIKMVSYGEEQPQCTEKKETCWQLNRRVHFIVLEESPASSGHSDLVDPMENNDTPHE